jgi:hypothetical protein
MSNLSYEVKQIQTSLGWEKTDDREIYINIFGFEFVKVAHGTLFFDAYWSSIVSLSWGIVEQILEPGQQSYHHTFTKDTTLKSAEYNIYSPFT